VGDRRLDDDTVERILAGLVDPVDAPPGYQAAVALLAAARGVPVPAPVRVARPVRAAGFRPRVPVLAAVLVLGGASGAAYAAGLPAAASSTAHAVLRSLDGAARPRTHAAPESPEAGDATTAAHPAPTGADTGAGRSHAGMRRHDPAGAGTHHGHRGHHGHGARISALAHSTTGTAGAKGATISAAASDGKSHAGEHGHNGANGSSHGQGHGHGGREHGHGHDSSGPR
jgi:hypothetical protein